jgi:DNA phosphorothioation-dependent restriction protein DptG
MTIMHMNVETVSEVQEKIAKEQRDIEERMTTLTAAVHGLEEGAWVGYSASQFFYEYEMIKRLMEQHMETMKELAERMKKEINEWQGVASSMGEYSDRLWV